RKSFQHTHSLEGGVEDTKVLMITYDRRGAPIHTPITPVGLVDTKLCTFWPAPPELLSAAMIVPNLPNRGQPASPVISAAPALPILDQALCKLVCFGGRIVAILVTILGREEFEPEVFGGVGARMKANLQTIACVYHLGVGLSDGRELHIKPPCYF